MNDDRIVINFNVSFLERMGKVTFIIFALIIVYIGYIYNKWDSKDTGPYEFPKNGYFGKGQPKQDDKTIKPFKINVSDEILTDLKDRLRKSRIGHNSLEDVNDFTYGFHLKTLVEFKDYWLNKYDWRKAEKQLNSFEQFMTQIEGLNIHYIHAKPSKIYKKVVPLLIVHGWPGNVYEFYKIIPMLTDPKKYINADIDYAFEVIAPSIPGYGWSEASHKSGFDQIATARIFNKLMTERLNFKKYLAQGGDWGSLVVSNLGRMYPENLYGVHVNMLFVNGGGLKNFFKHIAGHIAPSFMFKDSAYHNFNIKTMFLEIIKESGYMHIQATKPDTVGVGLNDSPIGLMAYILEKFSSWTNPNYRTLPNGGLDKKFTKDELLTIITIYWVNSNIVTSQRYYREFFSNPDGFAFSCNYVKAPTGYASFPYDLGIPMPPEIGSVAYNITHVTVMKDGGHFAAFEMPKPLAEDVFVFSNKLSISN